MIMPETVAKEEETWQEVVNKAKEFLIRTPLAVIATTNATKNRRAVSKRSLVCITTSAIASTAFQWQQSGAEFISEP